MNFFKRIKNKKGESLVEVLVSILIFTLASVALFTMCKTAAKLNDNVKAYTKRIEEQMALVEMAETTPNPSHSSVTFQFPGGHSIPAGEPDDIEKTRAVKEDIVVFGNDPGNSLFTFFRK